MASVNIALEIFSMVFSITLLICCLLEGRRETKRSRRIFGGLLFTNTLVLLADMMTWLLENKTESAGLLYFFNYSVFILGYVMIALYTEYLVAYMREKKIECGKIVLFSFMSSVVAILLVLISVFNHMYFSFDEGVYVRGRLFWVSQVYSILIILTNTAIILDNRKKLGYHDTNALLSYGLLPIVAMIVQLFTADITLLFHATTLSLMIVYITIHAEQGRRLLQREKELTQANFAVMLSQIQPHFLLNSLGAITELCEDNAEARDALITFSRYLRGNINSLKQLEPIPFDVELKHIKAYMYLEKLRFQDKLSIEYDIETDDFLVPSLTIQPILENAVKHGVGMNEDGGTVTLRTWEDSDSYAIEIKDDGVGFDPSKVRDDDRAHIGIENVQKRLKTMCDGTLTINSEKGRGTTAVIRIPKEAEE